MKVLIPGTFTLLSSTVPIDEAQIFTHRIYTIGDRVVYGNLLYERLTSVDTFPLFDNKKIYSYGETCSSAGVNYILQAQADLTAPSIDTTNWQQVPVSSWAVSTSYISGNIRTYLGRTYLCILAHTSPAIATVKDWLYGQPFSYYTGGMCRYNGRYYRSLGWVYYWFNNIVPTSSSYWVDVTETTILPAYASMYWADITHQLWNGMLLYNAGSVTLLDGNAYKALNNISFPAPASDPIRWMVSATSLPTNTTDWKNLGAVNRFRMFDQYFSTFTFSNEDMQVSLTDIDFNAVYVGNVFADSVTISVIDNTTAAVVENNTIDLTYDCVDIFDYFFGDWMDYRKQTVKYERTSVYNNVSCQLNFSGDFIRVGILAIGKAYFVGDEPWGVSDESLDFSTVIEDTSTGEVYLQEGVELKLKSVDLWVDTPQILAIDNVLKLAKGKPVVFLSKNENMDAYAFYRKKHRILNGPVKSLISLEYRELL